MINNEQVFDGEVIQKNIYLDYIDELTDKNTNNLLNVFKIQMSGKLPTSTTVKLKNQSLTGGGEPTIMVDNLTNANMLTPVQTIHSLKLIRMAYEFQLMDIDVETKQIDVNLAFKQVIMQFNFAMWNMLLTGGYKGKYILANNLFTQGNVEKSPISFTDGKNDANTLLAVITEMYTKITNATGRTPTTLLLDPITYAKIGLAKTTLSNFITIDYLQKTLNLNIVRTTHLSNVELDNGKKLGSCMVMITDSPQDLQLVLGELPYVGKKIDNTTFSTLTNVQGSFAGFVRLTPDKNAVQILTNVEG